MNTQESNPYQSPGEDPKASADSTANATKGGKKKLVILLVFVGLAVLAFTQFGEYLKLEALAERESQLRDYQADNPILVYGIAFIVYVAVTGMSLPGAAALTLVYGWYFGFAKALLLVSFASTAGATIAFLLSRYLFRDTIQQRFGDKLKGFNDALEREGPFFLFTLRLIPAVPFFVINAVMGLTPVRTGTYWWVSQVGMLPGTMVYVFAGSRVPNLQKLADEGINAVFSPVQLTQIIFAFALLGAFPLIVRYGMKFLNRNKPSADSTSTTETDTEA